MFREIFGFEVRYQFKQPIFWISLVIFFLLTFGAVTSDTIQIGGAIGNVHRNAPFVIMQFMLVMSAIGVFTTTAFVATSIIRDFEQNTHTLFFSTPLKKRDYLGGRFAGSLLIAFAVFFGVALAIMIGSFMPWLDAERIGPFMLSPYVYSMLVLVLPNLFLSGAIFFSLAALTRSMLYTYAGVIGFFVGYTIAGSFLNDLDNQFLASLLDPFGFASFQLVTRYWTVHQRNTGVLPLEGALLWNRVLWMSVGAVILAFSFWRFRFTASIEGRRSKKRKKAADEPIPIAPLTIPTASQTFSRGETFRQYIHQFKLELGSIVKSTPFLVIAALGVFNVLGSASAADRLFGTEVYPVTHLMINVIQGSFLLFSLIILTFYAGEVVWKERSLKLNEVYDALPAKTSVFWASKMSALAVSLMALLGIAMITAMGVQLGKGYTNLELPVYLKGLFLDIGPAFLLIGVLALFLQTVANNKYLGLLLMVLYFVSGPVLPAMDWEHNLYQFAGRPEATYSDMNGYGHFVQPMFWFYFYWACFGIVLLVLAHLFWVRGTESGWRNRLRLARLRFTAVPRVIAALALVAFVASGAWIFYNTNVLNEYRTGDDREKFAADFEKKYRKYENATLPRIVSVRTDVDIYPYSRDLRARGHYELVNRSGRVITEVPVFLNPDVRRLRLSVTGAKPVREEKRDGYTFYRFDPPLQPGGRARLDFDIAIVNDGFVNSGSNTNVVYNGTFINNFTYYPRLGYVEQLELVDRNDRRKHGLGPVRRAKKIDDPTGLANSFISKESDFINFETVVSTVPDQIAIAPGYLQREWTQNGRRYFHYRMDSPILGFFSFLSAKYEVKKDRWNDVAIEIYYHKNHPYNVDRMIDATKKSLDYFTKNFAPYQHRQVRIVEFPRYAQFAQSFPNTIPFSESIGFIANVEDKDEIDYVFYVTAHEVAHQWWAHQVVSADVQGSPVMSETMSQYGALMVMEKEYGKAKMQRFLRYELDRYLRGRGGELIEEVPLAYVENQPYIYYAKGSLAMYALRDAIGEERLNAAVGQYAKDVRFQGPPYTTTRDFLSYIRRQTPPDQQSLVNDLFESIVLFENKATEAKWKKRPDGKYDVKLVVEAKKLQSNGKGDEKEIGIGDWIDIGVTAKPAAGKKRQRFNEDFLLLERRRIDKPRMEFNLVVDREPGKAGIDPQNKLIDRNPEDNMKDVSE